MRFNLIFSTVQFVYMQACLCKSYVYSIVFFSNHAFSNQCSEFYQIFASQRKVTLTLNALINFTYSVLRVSRYYSRYIYNSADKRVTESE